MTAGRGGTHVWDLGTWPPTKQPPFPSLQEQSWAAFSPDGKWVATGGRDQAVRVIDAADGSVLMNLLGHGKQVERVEFGGEAMQLLTVGADATLRAWDLGVKQEMFVLTLMGSSALSSGGPPVRDFALRRTPEDDCRVAVLLGTGKLVLYQLSGVYRP